MFVCWCRFKVSVLSNKKGDIEAMEKEDRRVGKWEEINRMENKTGGEEYEEKWMME